MAPLRGKRRFPMKRFIQAAARRPKKRGGTKGYRGQTAIEQLVKRVKGLTKTIETKSGT